MKAISPYLISIMLTLFSYQIVGHYFLLEFGILSEYQIEIPFEERTDEKENESEEKEMKYTILQSLSHNLNNLMNGTFIVHKVLFRALFWLENDTLPPQG